MTTYREALAAAGASLRMAGVGSPALDARLLLAAASGLDMAALISRGPEELPPIEEATFGDHMRRRLSGEPVARILGEREFWGLPLAVETATLVPRPETETLVEAMLGAIGRRSSPAVTICDLGTGTGAIVIALLRELPAALGVATDISQEALAVARRNAERHGLTSRITFRNVDFAEGPDGQFDVVVANPPYIRSDEIDRLDRGVREYDPRIALDGGPDGLAAYRAILRRIDSLLADGGLLGLEVGADQGAAVVALSRAAGLSEIEVHRDLRARRRVVTAVKTIPAVESGGPKKALGKLWRSG